jgi:hypothetical protein
VLDAGVGAVSAHRAHQDTRPAAAARIGVPPGTAMSTPAWSRPHGIPNGRDDRPADRQRERAAPLTDRAGRGLSGDERGPHARLLRLERPQIAIERRPGVADLGEHGALVRSRGRELVARSHELALGGRDDVALAQELEGEGPLALLERRHIDRPDADCGPPGLRRYAGIPDSGRGHRSTGRRGHERFSWARKDGLRRSLILWPWHVNALSFPETLASRHACS